MLSDMADDYLTNKKIHVLILVLMEYALWHLINFLPSKNIES